MSASPFNHGDTPWLVDIFLEDRRNQGRMQDDKHKDTDRRLVLVLGHAATPARAMRRRRRRRQGRASRTCTSRSNVDKASPTLMLQCCANGKHIKKAVLFVRKAGREALEYLQGDDGGPAGRRATSPAARPARTGPDRARSRSTSPRSSSSTSRRSRTARSTRPSTGDLGPQGQQDSLICSRGGPTGGRPRRRAGRSAARTWSGSARSAMRSAAERD